MAKARVSRRHPVCIRMTCPGKPGTEEDQCSRCPTGQSTHTSPQHRRRARQLKTLGHIPRLEILRSSPPPGRTIKDLDPRHSIRPTHLHPVLILVPPLQTQLHDGMPDTASGRNHVADAPLTICFTQPMAKSCIHKVPLAWNPEVVQSRPPAAQHGRVVHCAG